MNYNCGIYLITNVINGKVYVGSSKSLTRRHYKHWYHLKRGDHSNPYLKNAWIKYGSQAFHWEILEYCDPTLLIEREDWWINFFDSRNPDKGYNIRKADRRDLSAETKAKLRAANLGKTLSDETKAKISSAGIGRIKSEDTRKKLSAANTGKPSHNKGKPMSDEQKAKISAANKGRKRTEEQRANISASLVGRTLSPEHIANRSAAQRGLPKSTEWKAKMAARQGMRI